MSEDALADVLADLAQLAEDHPRGASGCCAACGCARGLLSEDAPG